MATYQADYLIVGNSAAGVAAAEAIRARDAQGSVLMVSREPYPAYGRPLISYLVEGKTSEDKIWLKPADFYEKARIETLFGPLFEAVALLPDEHRVKLANGDEVQYGSCLLATGSVPFTPPIKGLAERDNVFPFMTLDDAKAAWAAAREATKCAHEAGRESRAIVIGAGLIGLKAAEALSHHVDEVLVLELAPRILPAVLDGEGAAILQELLAEHGIVCKPGVSADEIIGEGSTATGALLTDGERVSCDMVVAAVGVRPNSALAVEAGAEQGRGLVCDEALRTTLPDVYAAGDLVQVTDALDGAQRPLALWPNAVRQGKIAGAHMAGDAEAEPFTTSFAVNAVDFFDVSLLTSGVINPPDDTDFEVRTEIEGNRYAKFVTRAGKLVGYILLNRPENAGIYTALIEQGTPLDEVDARMFDAAPCNLGFSADERWARLHKGYPENRDKRGWKERA